MGATSSLPVVLSSDLWQGMLTEIRKSNLHMTKVSLCTLETKLNRCRANRISEFLAHTFKYQIKQSAERMRRTRLDHHDSKLSVNKFCTFNCQNTCQWKHISPRITLHEFELFQNQLKSKAQNVSMWVFLAQKQPALCQSAKPSHSGECLRLDSGTPIGAELQPNFVRAEGSKESQGAAREDFGPSR